MDWLNYHHLLYFWTAAKTGSITRAAEELRLAQPTVSAQVKSLEESLGVELFDRQGRKLELTEVGRVIFDYADEIFSLGRELMSVVRQQPTDRPLRLSVGITDSVPKLVAREMLEPALAMDQPVHIICNEGGIDRLVAEMAIHRVDVILCEGPFATPGNIKTFTHKLGTCDVTLFAAPVLATRLKRKFPESLDGAPALLPTPDSNLRRNLDRWFESVGVRPYVVAEFDDSALMKVFGQHGHGFFAAHSVVADDIVTSYGAKPIHRIPECQQTFYAVSAERRHKHPGVIAITDAARSRVFT